MYFTDLWITHLAPVFSMNIDFYIPTMDTTLTSLHPNMLTRKSTLKPTNKVTGLHLILLEALIASIVAIKSRPREQCI